MTNDLYYIYTVETRDHRMEDIDMAWYYGTYSCGHEGRVNIIGPTKDRQWKADRHFGHMCPECYENGRKKSAIERAWRLLKSPRKWNFQNLRVRRSR